MAHAHHGGTSPGEGGRSRPNGAASNWLVSILIVGAVGIGAYYVIAEHGAHLSSAWLLLFLLACPFLHMFHGGHGGHGGHGARDKSDDAGSRNA